MDHAEQKLVQQANAALQEIKRRMAQEEELMKAMLSVGIHDYEGGESPIARAIRYFKEKE